MKNNLVIRNKARMCNVRLWEVADAMKVHESFFSKKLRKELPPQEQNEILSIIDDIAKKKGVTSDA